MKETLDRCQIRYILGGQAAEALNRSEDLFDADELLFHVHLNDFSPYKDWLDPFLPGLIRTEKEITYSFQDVPIRIQIHSQKYAFFTHPDMKFYYLGEFPLPNPLREYLGKDIV